MFGFRDWKIGRRGWLRPWVLSILSRSPKNGAEIMDEIERMSWGSWRPSPGSVYPLLDEMTSEGLITKSEDGRYQVTEKAKSEMEWPFGMPFQHKSNSVDEMLKEINGYVSYFEDLNRSDKTKLAANTEKLRDLGGRMTRLAQQ
ncbi:MAG: PadR family transcriptional regulator [Nitrososphaerales archaeon]